MQYQKSKDVWASVKLCVEIFVRRKFGTQDVQNVSLEKKFNKIGIGNWILDLQ